MPAGKYAYEQSPPSYDHGRHAGNVGDVWKHCVLTAWVGRLVAQGAALTCLDCHAGAGSYRLGATGEWTEGIGRLAAEPVVGTPEALAVYLQTVRALGGGGEGSCYPGSPRLLLQLLRAQDQLLCSETDEAAHAALSASLGGDERAEVRRTDGLALLPVKLDEARRAARRMLAQIDPPWTAKQDWQSIPAALLEGWRRAPQAAFLLWYPIKSYTRVAAMQKRLRDDGLPFVCLDLISTPLEYQRNRLNGSGVLLVNAPQELIEGLGAAAVRIAARCALFPGQWQFGARAFGASERPKLSH